MAIIIGDIHGDEEKVQAFLSYKPEDEHISLGDYVDGEGGTRHDLKTLRLLLESKAILLWGNHELEHLTESPFIQLEYDSYICPENNIADPVTQLIEINKERFKAAHAVDGWFCTHAGVRKELVHTTDIKQLVDKFNGTAEEVLLRGNRQLAKESHLFEIGAGVPDDPGGIFWFRHETERSLAKNINQIFGHEISWPMPKRNAYPNGKESISLATNYRSCWVFDTRTNELVKLWEK